MVETDSHLSSLECPDGRARQQTTVPTELAGNNRRRQAGVERNAAPHTTRAPHCAPRQRRQRHPRSQPAAPRALCAPWRATSQPRLTTQLAVRSRGGGVRCRVSGRASPAAHPRPVHRVLFEQLRCERVDRRLALPNHPPSAPAGGATERLLAQDASGDDKLRRGTQLPARGCRRSSEPGRIARTERATLIFQPHSKNRRQPPARCCPPVPPPALPLTCTPRRPCPSPPGRTAAARRATGRAPPARMSSG